MYPYIVAGGTMRPVVVLISYLVKEMDLMSVEEEPSGYTMYGSITPALENHEPTKIAL